MQKFSWRSNCQREERGLKGDPRIDRDDGLLSFAKSGETMTFKT